MILAGDIGGTKTNLALFDWTTERVDPVREETFHSADYTALDEILAEFLSQPMNGTESDRGLGDESADRDRRGVDRHSVYGLQPLGARARPSRG